jgi:hypothetical protein
MKFKIGDQVAWSEDEETKDIVRTLRENFGPGPFEVRAAKNSSHPTHVQTITIQVEYPQADMSGTYEFGSGWFRISSSA